MFNPSPFRNNQNPIVIDSDGDENDSGEESDSMPVQYTGRQVAHPGMVRYNAAYNVPTGPSSNPNTLRPSAPPPPPQPGPYHTSIEQEKKVRSRLREERHAALCVLTDRELLTIQALAAQETLPQARRRFLAKMLAPEDPDVAASIRADQFTLHQRPSSSALLASANPKSDHEQLYASKLVSRRVVDVCETDDASWYRPEDTSGGGGGASSGVSSPASSSKTKGRGTPDRARNKGRTSLGRQQQQRERRRRWSGAERQDHGVSMLGLPP